ncbi:patatin-like phospholipase family protein [Roseateles cellulosilyticus]|uniref:Patatin-like phospholipase family protein n=1 Tax=Pelomonas cellulosilytica TaxID=2906762 RepID=A0ABS8XV67_9BURK|nr:patatin-like phospholipase family protein [Pelomonas sp. P8]MCE4554787.1 patatin-like phospholipase family protein [Pelomonas sp. P8]
MATRSKHRAPHRIALALQGGGSHGAFTWGVLDRLLQEPDLEIVGISGTSAGAMNAGILADALRRGGPEHARQELARYWTDVGALPGFSSFSFTMPGREPVWHLDENPVFRAMDFMTRVWSPYQTNPANLNPLRGLLERIDFEGLRHDTRAARVFVTATNVRTGLRHVFVNEDLSIDALLASACLPQMMQAVEIDGESYWDGGYTGNPSLSPLYLYTQATDVIAIGINPIERPQVPRSARAIIDRIDEISFNSTLMLELAAVAFIEDLVRAGAARGQFKSLFVHGIGDTTLATYGASSKINNDMRFLRQLHARGVEAAERWLQAHRAALGQSSSLDLTPLLPTAHGLLTGTSVIKAKPVSPPAAKPGTTEIAS